MRVIRVLHPVGQGAFYTEQFIIEDRKINVVFDCGSENSQAMTQCVDEYCKHIQPRDSKPVIDAVFISHFDEDHISGLEELFSKCFIKKIFLPLIDDSKVYSISASFFKCLNSAFFKSVLNSAISGNPIDGYGDTKVIRVEPAENNDAENDSIIPLDDDSINVNGKKIRSGTGLSLSNNGRALWIFRTFNYDNDKDQRTNPLLQILGADNIKLSLNEILQNLFNGAKWLLTGKTYKELVHDAYDSVGTRKTKNINDNSMVTYSGPINEDIQCCSDMNIGMSYCDYRCHVSFGLRDKAGCIYFGDYNAKSINKFKQYENHFKNQINLLHLLQIPHHGSYANYNSKLNDPPKISFISAGLHNSYKHPNGSVLLDMNQNAVSWFWIHEYFGYLIVNYDVRP